MEHETTLKTLYRNIGAPQALGNAKQLASASGHIVKVVQKWLSSQLTHQLHKPLRNKFPRNTYFPQGLHFTWQVDLYDLRRLKSHNNNATFLLGAIDLFSKQGFVRALTSKSGDVVANAMRSILVSNPRKIPVNIYSDKGTEFTGRKFRKLMQEFNIHHYTVTSIKRKAYIVERWWRTLLNLIYRYLNEFRTKKYTNALQQLVDIYNSRYHSSIGMAPVQVNMKNQHLVGKKFNSRIQSKQKPRFYIGDTVRLAIPKKLFAKGYM